ncbi:hypothetical protein VDG1235_2635 [Verrucomicrobiia bacterium DG1235]|nr:hypothetical protein VDG1235_2635 [Verrucomicrobiae bacterium DG1235]
MKNLSVLLTTLSLILSVLIGIVISRSHTGTDSSSPDHKLLIGLSMDTLQEARWQVDRDVFLARAKELGAEVSVASANSDDSTQIRDVNSMISAGVDVIVIIPHDGQAMSEGVRQAHQAGIPVIAYDRSIQDSDLDLYITFDNVKVGEAQAQYLIDHLPSPGKGRIVRIYGAPTDNNAKMFKQGQDNILQPYIDRGDIEVIHEDWAENWEPANAKKITNAAITNNGSDFHGILASNDGTAGGAIQALKEEGLVSKIIVTGQDAEMAACQRIVDGSQIMTIYKPIKALASTAAELAVSMATGQPIIARGEIDNGFKTVPSIFLPITSVDKSNMMQTVIADGFHSFEEVYRNVPEAERPRSN